MCAHVVIYTDCRPLPRDTTQQLELYHTALAKFFSHQDKVILFQTVNKPVISLVETVAWGKYIVSHNILLSFIWEANIAGSNG